MLKEYAFRENMFCTSGMRSSFAGQPCKVENMETAIYYSTLTHIQTNLVGIVGKLSIKNMFWRSGLRSSATGLAKYQKSVKTVCELPKAFVLYGI